MTSEERMEELYKDSLVNIQAERNRDADRLKVEPRFVVSAKTKKDDDTPTPTVW
jgi:hypothetical protein